MKRRVDLSIGQRLALGFGLAGALLALLVGMSLFLTAQIAAGRQRLSEVVAPRAAAADRLEAEIFYMSIAARNYVLMPEPRRLLAYERGVRQVRVALQTLGGLPKEPDGLEMFARLPQLAEKYELASKTMVESARLQRDVQALEPEMARAREELLAGVREYAVLQQRKMEQTRAHITDAVRSLNRAVLGLGAIVFVMLAITGWLTTQAVRQPALALVATARRLAKGDFAPAVELLEAAAGDEPRRDELAELGLSFGRMAADLQMREQRLRASAKLSAALAASLDVGRLCDAGLQSIVSHLDVEVGALYLMDQGSMLRRRFAIGLPSGEEETLTLGEGVPGRAAQSRRTVTTNEIPADSPFTIRLGVDSLPPRTVAAVPMVLQDDELLGVLMVGSVRTLPAGAIEFLEHSATQLAVSIQNGLGHERITQLALDLQDKNETLQGQQEELQAQQEELQAQQEELQAQQEELQAQNEELQAQGEELQCQGDELRGTVERLTASEERYHGLFVHLSEGFALHELICDDAGRAIDYRFLAANPAYELATGLKSDQLLGKSAKQLIPTLEQSWVDRYAEVVSSGQPARFETTSGPHRRQHQVIAFRVGSRQFATLFMDVTDQKRAEEALRDADKNKNDFLAMLSHELRNPLAPIKNSLYVLEETEPGSAQAKRAQTVIARQVAQLARLVEDLLDVTRISRGKVQLRTTRVELGTVLRQAAEDHRTTFSERGITLTLQVESEPVVSGDPARLSQVIGNLLQNAAKFTPTGGHVLLALEAGEGTARIRVRDTGAGMDPDTLGRLFQPFVQADVTLARTNGGLGLGLALVKGLVEMHGGSVHAASDGPGTGAELVVELPISHDAAVVSESRAAPSPVARRVLVVEDNLDGAESLRELLALNGHEVEVAYRGADGIAKARDWRPDVVLCDIGLPDINGHDVARAFRSDPLLRSVFLVALTGYALPADLERASEAGFNEHLAKPACIDRLKEVLASAAVAPQKS
jgi:PAS domain S-box-containing protein